MKETERERTRKEKEADDNFRSRGTAAADLCGDENPGKSLSRRLSSYSTSIDHLTQYDGI